MIHKIWCESCHDWVSDFRPTFENKHIWTLCAVCGEGLVLSLPEIEDIYTDKKDKILLAKAIWGLK